MEFALRVTSPPGSEPVSLSEMKAHLRVDSSDEDALISGLISAARGRVENETSRALITQTLRLTLARFPDGRTSIMIPRPALQTVSSVSYYDSDGALQTLGSSAYVVQADYEPARLQLAESEVDGWPDTDSDRLDTVQITYVAGWADANAVPTPLKSAIMLIAAHLFEHREEASGGAAVKEVPMSVKPLLAPYIVPKIATPFGG